MGSKRKRTQKERTQEQRLAAIDRFAGSSEEEDEENEEEEVPMKPMQPAAAIEGSDDDVGDMEQDDKETEVDSEDDEILTESAPAASGMANAMARILGPNPTTSTTKKPVVLSKTTTKLQLELSKEAQELKELKARRKLNREKRLTCYHVPSATDVDEVEQERYHRRVATRGVVALFNAIAQHQQKATNHVEEEQTTPKEKPIGKESFLAKIKQQAVVPPKSTPDKPPVQKVKWEALSDGFKVSSKKNWDEESSSDEDNADKELVQVEEEE